MKPTTWFDRLLTLLDRMDTERLLLLREVVNALAAQRLAGPSYPTLEAALTDAAEKS